MCKEIKYCPNCVSEMSEDKRKLGRVTKWYKCPSCGVREEIVDEVLESMREQKVRELIKKQEVDVYNGESNEDYQLWLVQQDEPIRGVRN